MAVLVRARRGVRQAGGRRETLETYVKRRKTRHIADSFPGS
jgi:hypothetical protein